MEWFLVCLDRAIEGAPTALGAILAKARFWENAQRIALNERKTLLPLCMVFKEVPARQVQRDARSLRSATGTAL